MTKKREQPEEGVVAYENTDGTIDVMVSPDIMDALMTPEPSDAEKRNIMYGMGISMSPEKDTGPLQDLTGLMQMFSNEINKRDK